MEPVASNSLSKTCPEPISSNCVAYNGPAIECLNLCKGATITDVIYQLSTLVCYLMKQVDLTGLDLKCICDSAGSANCCPEGYILIQNMDGTYACRSTNGKGTITRPIACPDAIPCPDPVTIVSLLQYAIDKKCAG